MLLFPPEPTDEKTTDLNEFLEQFYTAITNSDSVAITVLLARIKDITVFMSALTKRALGLIIYKELIKHDNFYQLLESLPLNPAFFSGLVDNTLQQKAYEFTKNLLKLLANLSAKPANKNSYVFYDCIVYCQCIVANYTVVDQNFNALLEIIRINMLGVVADEALFWLEQQEYINALTVINNLQKNHVVAVGLRDAAVTASEHRQQFLQEALRLCDSNQVEDYVSILEAYSPYIVDDVRQSIAKKIEYTAELVTAIKKMPLSNDPVNIILLIIWLKKHYEYLVRQAQIDTVNRKKILLEAKKMKAELVHYVNSVLTLLLEAPGAQEIKHIVFLEKYILLSHRNPVKEIFKLLINFIESPLNPVSKKFNTCANNLQLLQSLLRSFFHDDSYWPEIKLQIFNQFLKILNIISNDFIQSEYSQIFNDLVNDIKQIISDMMFYKKDSLSLRNKIRYFSALPHRGLTLDSTLEYFDARNQRGNQYLSVPINKLRAEERLESKIINLLSDLETELISKESIDISRINGIVDELQKFLINKEIYVAVETASRIATLVKKFYDFGLYPETNKIIDIFFEVTPEFSFELINDVLLVEHSMMFSIFISVGCAEHRMPYIADINLALNEYNKAFETEIAKLTNIKNINLELLFNKYYYYLKLFLRNMLLPYLVEFYNLLKQLINSKYLSLDILSRMSVLLHSINHDLTMLPNNVVNIVLNQTYQILDIYLLQLLRNKQFDVDFKCQLLDFLITLQTLLSRLDIDNRVKKENRVTGDITVFLYPKFSWLDSSAEIIYLMLQKTIITIKTLKQESCQYLEDEAKLVACLNLLQKFHRQRFCFHQVFEIVNLFLIILSNYFNYETMPMLSYYINQFYYQCPLDIADQIDYFTWFKTIAKKILDTMLLNDMSNCDSILLLDSIVENIDKYLGKLNLKLNSEVTDKPELGVTLKPCAN